METTTHLGFNKDTLDAFVDGRGEPCWLQEQRRAAWSTYCQKDWPARDDEEWRRTDIRLLRIEKFGLGSDGQTPPATSRALLREGVRLAGHSVSFNNRPHESGLEAQWSAQGVIYGSLDDAVVKHGDLLRAFLFRRAVDPNYDKFSALHAAFWSGGHFLYVPRGVVVAEPFHALSVLSDNRVDLGHTLVVLEEGAEATVLTETESVDEDSGGLHCGGMELILAPRSHLRFVSLQNWGQGVWHFAHQKAIVDRDASLQWTIGAMGGRLAKVNQHVVLAGDGARCQVNGVMFTEGKQHFAYHTLQHHQARHSQSDFLYKAALQDRSRTVWRGMIKVDPGAMKTDGYQRNDNLLLSSQARADSIPGLEIEADDVRCTHGSTSGRVDEEMIFYSRCRGFTRKEAIQMIVTGFFQQVFDRITIESVREAMARAIARRVREYE